MRNLADKTDNVSTLSAAEFNNSIAKELENVVTDAGITLDGPSGPDTNTEMLSQAVTRASQGGWLYQDGGSANTYTLSAIAGFKQPDSYTNGMTVMFLIGTTNTGASTINVSSLGSKDLVSADGSALSGGELVADKYAIATYSVSSGDFHLVLENESAQISTLEKNISQSSHGFSVDDVLRLSGTSYTEAQADSAANAQVIGIVSAVADTDNFTLTTGGLVSGLTGLTAGTVYYLSPATAGLLTATEPTTDGQVSKPVLIADTTTSGYLINSKGVVVGEGVSPIAAWVKFDATGTATITKDQNFLSITDLGTGHFRFTLDVTMSDTDYLIVGSSGEAAGAAGDEMIMNPIAQTTTTFDVRTVTGNGNSNDVEINSIIIIGEVA